MFYFDLESCRCHNVHSEVKTISILLWTIVGVEAEICYALANFFFDEVEDETGDFICSFVGNRFLMNVVDCFMATNVVDFEIVNRKFPSVVKYRRCAGCLRSDENFLIVKTSNTEMIRIFLLCQSCVG